MRRTISATTAEMNPAIAAFLAGRRGGTGPARTPARSRGDMATAARAIKPTRVNARARRTP
ncbi:hypothetical protein ACFYXH_08500 [Streptomyces sp. NPDC002730]|uniref:hypothetical protein n=1 Tax=Streptomyces sp. NPDC002730 TaxID=3364662 RepID=UPI00368D0BBC